MVLSSVTDDSSNKRTSTIPEKMDGFEQISASPVSLAVPDSLASLDLLDFAKHHNLTPDGTFFNKRNLAKLVATHISTKKHFTPFVTDNFPSLELIKSTISNNNGDFFMVAYDRQGVGVDFLNGKKAHWCVITGFVGDFKETDLIYCQHSNSLTPFIVEYDLLRKSNGQLGDCDGRKDVDLWGAIFLRRSRRE